jgi:hypothetical protein
MAAPLVTIAELKTYLGLTGLAEDGLLASAASNASVQAEQDTGRVFAVTSNVTRVYSSDGQSSLTVHDRPYNDATRVVTWLGTALVEGTNTWFLQDRRNPDVSTTIQLHPYDRGAAGWWRSFPNWFDANLDRPSRQTGTPNDLSITGTEGHPQLPLDVKQAVTELAALIYYRSKSGASGTVTLPTGEAVELGEQPTGYQRFVDRWRIRTAVSVV